MISITLQSNVFDCSGGRVGELPGELDADKARVQFIDNSMLPVFPPHPD